MSKFTPGPWTVNTNVRYAINAKDKHIAMVSSYEMFESDRVENEANARLIAAAPGMYEALRKAIEWIEDDRVDDEYISEQWYHEAKAALRAADGGE